MGKAVKRTRFRNVKIKVVRRSITGSAKFSYLGQAPPQPNSKHTHSLDPSTSITPQQAEPDDVAPSCSLYSETAYSKAKKRELHAWDAVKDDMLKVSFECSAPTTTQCVVCLEKHADYRCIECSTTAVFCEACLKRTHRNSLHLPDKWNVSTIAYVHTYRQQSHSNFNRFIRFFLNCFGTMSYQLLMQLILSCRVLLQPWLNTPEQAN